MCRACKSWSKYTTLGAEYTRKLVKIHNKQGVYVLQKLPYLKYKRIKAKKDLIWHLKNMRLCLLMLSGFYFSVCNEHYQLFTKNNKDSIKRLLPNDLQNNLLCATSTVNNQGSCKGDSGGPLMIFNWKTRRWILVASVEGQIGECGNHDYPGIYVRISQKDVFSFIQELLSRGIDGDDNDDDAEVACELY